MVRDDTPAQSPRGVTRTRPLRTQGICTENTDLRRTLALYEKLIRQRAIENDARRGGATVVPLPSGAGPHRHPRPDPRAVRGAQRA